MSNKLFILVKNIAYFVRP